jgi:hypothetical protein
VSEGGRLAVRGRSWGGADRAHRVKRSGAPDRGGRPDLTHDRGARDRSPLPPGYQAKRSSCAVEGRRVPSDEKRNGRMPRESARHALVLGILPFNLRSGGAPRNLLPRGGEARASPVTKRRVWPNSGQTLSVWLNAASAPLRRRRSCPLHAAEWARNWPARRRWASSPRRRREACPCPRERRRSS